jgi:clumping factor A
MIVFSLVLILVAVALLVLGLTAGSSSLLIASIVASLLAAVALVIGARRAAALRRSAAAGPDPAFADPAYADPAYAEPLRRPGRRRAASDVVGTGHTPAGAGDLSFETIATGNTPAGAAADAPLHAEAAAYAAGYDDVEDAYGSATGPEGAVYGGSSPEPEAYDEPAPHPEEPLAEEPAAVPVGDQPDYDRAAGFIGGARAPGQPRDNTWTDDARTDEPVTAEGTSPETGYPDGSGLSEEFGEPDPDDPEDEPLPQAIRPGDAVRVTRMDAEVLVVDARPRYHLADCPHLIGRLTEGLPVAEAVELGFTPCGLCRPVDRLVAAAARG